jgi:hypothetical protein
MSIFESMLRMKFYPLIILALLILVGCSNATVLPQATPASPAPTPSPPPFGEATPTYLPSPTVQARPTVTIAEECIQIEENIPADLILSGVWVRNEAIPYLENLDEHVDYIVPLEGGGLFSTSYGDMAISPDGKYLAYIDKYYDPENHNIEKRILRIIKSSGHSLSMDYWVEDWQWIISWVDNQSLAIFTSKREIILLNPFTGEWKEFQKPDWLIYSDRYWEIPPLFSPRLDQVLVRLEYNNQEIKSLQTGDVVWQTDYSGHSSWSADGSVLAVVSSKLINLIKDGEQVIEYDISNIGIDSVFYQALSPNGQKIILKTYEPPRYFIFYNTQPMLKELCINGLNLWKEPFWSPDNRFIVQEGYKSYYEKIDLLIDTQEMRAYKFTSGQYQHPLIWLAKP